MNEKRVYKRYPPSFKEEAVALVTEQGYSEIEAAKSLGIRPNQLYDWKAKLEAEKEGTVLSTDELHLHRRLKALFVSSRNSLGSRELSKKLREEGFVIGRYCTRTLMRKLGLKVQQRVKYKVTAKRKHSDAVADNLLSQNFNPVGVNEVWAGEIIYL